jgi:hypothetical protein
VLPCKNSGKMLATIIPIKNEAVSNLEDALDEWKVVADITSSHYRTSLPIAKQEEPGFEGFDWSRYIKDVERDLNIAKNE